MWFLILKAYLWLVIFDFRLSYGSFERLYRKVRSLPVSRKAHSSNLVETLCFAIDVACIWYPKKALCLQRSAATACLLKQYGIAAQLVIGAQQMPFKAHAWVEVEGRIVNDKPYMREIYAVLDRC
jgi:Transglutaminase-like superfamily